MTTILRATIGCNRSDGENDEGGGVRGLGETWLKSGFPQRLENLENENGHGKIMKHKKLVKSHGMFWISHGILPILPPDCTKLHIFLPPLRNQASMEKVHIFSRFPQNVVNTKLRKQRVMENQEMVREKSWTNIWSSLWEPWFS